MPMPFSRVIALALAATFAAVGLLFFLAPASVTALFEQAAQLPALRAIPPGDTQSDLFRVLAAAYMYVVSWLAWMTFSRPHESMWPTALAQAKLASSTLSIAFAALHGPTLVLLANAVVDALLGVLALWLRRQATGRLYARRTLMP